MRVELPVYKTMSVPIYYYPAPAELQSIRDLLVKMYGTVKRAKAELRRRYRCFLSENAIWRAKVYTYEVRAKAEPPVKPDVKLINVMVRGVRSGFDYRGLLSSMGLRPNPYRTPHASKPPYCFGFYAHSYEEVEMAVDEMGRSGAVDGAMIVNAVWYMKLKRPVNLAKLIRTGIFMSNLSNFKSVTGVIDDGVKVTVFSTGTVRIVRTPTPERALEAARKVYGLLLQLGAFEG